MHLRTWVVPFVGLVGAACSTFSATPTDAPADAAADGPSDASAADADAHVLPAGTLDDFEGPAPFGCSALWQATESELKPAPGEGINGSQACRMCSNVVGFAGMQTATLVDASAGQTYLLEVSASYQRRPDGGGPSVFTEIHGLPGLSKLADILPAAAGSWKSGTALLTLDKDMPLWVSVSMSDAIQNDCVLVDDVKFIRQ